MLFKEMSNKQVERYSVALVIREMQVETVFFTCHTGDLLQ